MDIQRIINLAARIASRSDVNMRVGAIIWRRNRIISVGWNQRKTHPQSAAKWPSLHAEHHALLGCDQHSLYRANIAVVRITKSGLFARSRPCPSCYALLRMMGLSRMIYIGDHRRLMVESVFSPMVVHNLSSMTYLEQYS